VLVDAEEISALMFGRAMRLPVLLWLRQRNDPSMYLTEARNATGYEAQHLADELERLAKLGMVSKLERQRKNDRQYFVRNDGSPLWSIVDAAGTALSNAATTTNAPVAGIAEDTGQRAP
jgi:hypothetical protein